MCVCVCKDFGRIDGSNAPFVEGCEERDEDEVPFKGVGLYVEVKCGKVR